MTVTNGAGSITVVANAALWRAPVALTITEIWCEGDNAAGSTLDLQIDDGSPADVAGADLDCDDTPATDNTGLTGGMAAGDRRRGDARYAV